jgi:hypothetical protein
MNKPAIHILHKPTGMLLCEDGVFRSGIISCFCKQDTLLYRSVGHALRRLNTRKPGKAIRKDMLDEVVLDVVEADYGTTGKTYHMNRNGVIL